MEQTVFFSVFLSCVCVCERENQIKTQPWGIEIKFEFTLMSDRWFIDSWGIWMESKPSTRQLFFFFLVTSDKDVFWKSSRHKLTLTNRSGRLKLWDGVCEWVTDTERSERSEARLTIGTNPSIPARGGGATAWDAGVKRGRGGGVPQCRVSTSFTSDWTRNHANKII